MTETLRFSKFAIWGFALACLSVVVFGFIGIVGVGLSARGFQDVRRGLVRGRGLAIAGMIIGFVAFLFYVVVLIVRLH